MTREELIKRIALKMDEISSSDEIVVPVGTGDNNPLYTQINYLLNECVNDVLMKAPIYRLQSHISSSTDSNSQSIFNGARIVAVITVPTDFLRLVSITDNSLQRPIVELAEEGDDKAKKQHNRHLVAKTAKPVGVISNGSIGRTITCYSFDSTPSPTLTYIKRYNGEKDTTAETELDEFMIDVVSWVCAGRVFAAQGDINKSKICEENALALMV